MKDIIGQTVKKAEKNQTLYQRSEMATRKSTLRHFKKIYPGITFSLISILAVLMITSGPQAGVANGKVTSIRGNVIGLDVGSEKGINLGESGRIYYDITIDGKKRPIFIAKFKITYLAEKSSTAQIEEKTAEVRVGYLVEVATLGVELEVRSEPSGAKVYIDGKEVGETPTVRAGVQQGQHSIRIVKEGYGPYEVSEVIGADPKKVTANLKKLVREGELAIRSDPPGASVYLDGQPVGRSPYDGKGLSPKMYRVQVIKEGYEVWEREQAVEAGKKVEVLAQLKEKEGELEIRSDPSEAKVYMDGKDIGETPLVLSRIRLGRYLIRILKEGYSPYEERVEVAGGDRKTVLASLERLVGDLSVGTDPPQADVYIDGKSVGMSPYVGQGLLPGTRRVRVVKEGYEVWEKEVAIEAGKRVEVHAMLREKKAVAIPPKKPELPKEKEAKIAEVRKPGKIPTIGYLSQYSGSGAPLSGNIKAFLEGLRELGYVEGKNIAIE
jgi:hypothetical protein